MNKLWGKQPNYFETKGLDLNWPQQRKHEILLYPTLPELIKGGGKLLYNRSRRSFYALFGNEVWASLWWCLYEGTVDKNRDVHPYATAHDVTVSIGWRMFSHKTDIFCPNPAQLCHCKALKSSIPSRSNNENHFSLTFVLAVFLRFIAGFLSITSHSSTYMATITF